MVKIQVLDEIYNVNNNAFDCFRFFLAVFVILSHSYPLLLGPQLGFDWLFRNTHGQLALGQFAVECFFIISGFLITQSMINSKSYTRYVMKRILRILPAFSVSLFLTSFVLGCLLTEIGIIAYFNYPGPNNPFLFFLHNLFFNIKNYSWAPGDLFSHNPYAGSANGSMWTLKHEFAMYLFIPVASYFLFLKHRLLMLLSTIGLLILYYRHLINGYMLFNLSKNYWVIGNLEYGQFIKLIPYFFMGSLLYLYKDKIVFSRRLIALSAIFLIISIFLGKSLYVMPIILPYMIIASAALLKLSSFSKYGDFSYGIYIYAFPVQQTLVYFFKSNFNVAGFFFASTFITIIISILSWHFIEKPALKLKNINFNKKSPKGLKA